MELGSSTVSNAGVSIPLGGNIANNVGVSVLFLAGRQLVSTVSKSFGSEHLKLQSHLDYPDIDYLDFFSGPVYFHNYYM